MTPQNKMKKIKLKVNENKFLDMYRILRKVQKRFKLEETDRADAENLIYEIEKIAEKKKIILLMGN